MYRNIPTKIKRLTFNLYDIYLDKIDSSLSVSRINVLLLFLSSYGSFLSNLDTD